MKLFEKKTNKRSLPVAKNTIPIFMAIVVLLGLLLTGAGVTYGAYTTGSFRVDQARMSKFNIRAVSTKGQENGFVLNKDNPTATYEFTLNADCEVAWEYDVVVTFSCNPDALDGIALTIANKDSGSLVSMTKSSGLFGLSTVYTAKCMGTAQPGKVSYDFALQILAELNVSESIDAESFTIDVYARQID